MAEEKKGGAAQVAPAARNGIVLEVPPGVTVVSAGGQSFSAIEGLIEVPAALVADVRVHLASLWRSIRRDAASAALAAETAASQAEMPAWARAFERRVFGG